MVTKYVYNNDKKALDDIAHCQKAILSVTNNFIELGYVTKSIYYDLFCIDNVIYYGIYENVKDFFIFDENIGYYIPITEITEISKLPGLGGFPYSFARNYEAIFNFNVFSDKQAVNENKEYWQLNI